MSRRAWVTIALFKLSPVIFWLLPFPPGPGRTLGAWAAALFFFGTDIFLFYQLFVPSSQALCRVFTRFETERPEIWLTIDDGPDPDDTPRILELLERHRARATFFVIGERAEKHPALLAEILRSGHGLAHHTHTHPGRTFWCAGPERVRREIDGGLAALRRAGSEPRWFRPAVGIKSFFLGPILQQRGLECVGWSVRSHDSILRDPERIVRRVLARLRPGAIVLVHEGEWLSPRVRVRALERLLEELAARKFACVLPERAQLR